MVTVLPLYITYRIKNLMYNLNVDSRSLSGINSAFFLLSMYKVYSIEIVKEKYKNKVYYTIYIMCVE